MTKQEFVISAQDFIRKNQIKEVFEIIYSYLKQEEKNDSDLYYDSLLLEAQWKREQRNQNLNISDSSFKSNKIIASLTNIIRGIDEEEYKSVLSKKKKSKYRWMKIWLPYFFSIGLLGGVTFWVNKNFKQYSERLEYVEKRKERKYTFLVPANKMWENSNVVIQPGEKITIKASGRVNLSCVHNIEYAQMDKEPLFKWTSPEGVADLPPKMLYQNRKKMLISPIENYGALLMYPNPKGAPAPKPRNPTPKSEKYQQLIIEKVGNELTYSLPTEVKEPTTLFFTVNDTYIMNSKENRSSFVSEQKYLNEVYGQKIDKNGDPMLDSNNNPLPKYSIQEMASRWEKIQAAGFYDLWFEDNLGSFLVEITFLEKNP